MNKNISKNVNYFVFSGTLFIGLIIGLFFPDVDQGFQNLLGHRSIITHSILFPYLLYHYLIKKKKDPKVRDINLIIGIFLGIGLHLSADLYPKEWVGYALIKLPGNIDVGGLSPIWMGLNVIAATYFSAILLKKITNTKKYWTTYLVIGSVVGLVYTAADEGEVVAKFLTFLFFLFFRKIKYWNFNKHQRT